MTSEQLRAGRALLGWSQADLAQRAELSIPTVKRLESGKGPSVSDQLRHRLAQALQIGGVEFIPQNGGGPGVRLRARI